MLRILVITFLALAVVVATASAQTTTTTQSTTPTSNPNQGAYDKLSPGNQKIANALFDAQQTSTQPSGSTSGTSTGSTSTASKTYTRDDIAAMKQSGKGWGVVFKEMKANGYYPGAKNLGQVVSGKYQPQSGTTGSTTITSASGKSQVVGNSTKAGKSRIGHFEDDASAGARGSSYRDNSGRGSVSSGPGRGYGYGHGDRSGSSASTGSSGPSSHGRGHGK